MQSNMRPSYIGLVLTLEAGPDIYLSESLFEVSSYPPVEGCCSRSAERVRMCVVCRLPLMILRQGNG